MVAGAEDIVGRPEVIDGRTLIVAGERLRLNGIDAPDLDQTCEWPNKTIPCGRVARTALMDLVAGVDRVVCTPRATDADGHRVAVCLADGFDMGANMVHTGWAVAVDDGGGRYGAIQRRSKAAARGLWRGRFVPPRGGQVTATDTYLLREADEEAQAEIYAFLQSWWYDRRGRPVDDETMDWVLQTYRDSIHKPYQQPLREAMTRLAGARAAGEPFSVLDLGCANGPLLAWIKTWMDAAEIRFCGIEFCDFFVKDIRRHHPDAVVFHGAAEEVLAARPPEVFGTRFTVFVASAVLCMIHPRVVERLLAEISRVTDTILIRDYYGNIFGSHLGAVPLVFHYNDGFPMFAHLFGVYLRASGFEITRVQDCLNEHDRPGWALITASRQT